MRRATALILGGGPAGSAAAITMARAGIVAELVERQRAPHDVVCGGFLGWDSIAALKRLGLDIFTLGALPISRLRLIDARRCVEVALPRRAAGFSRRALDAALLSRALEEGTIDRRGLAAREVDPATRVVRLHGGEEVTADALFLATGKHELRGTARPAAWTGRGAVGLRTRLTGALAGPPLDESIELHLFDGGYAGLLVQEDGSANVCLSVARQRLSAAGSPTRLIADLATEAPRLIERIGDPDRHDWQAIAGVPYGWRAKSTEPGLFRLGDQAAVISSLAGDGVGIALHSGIAAAEAFARRGAAGARDYQAAFARQARVPLGVAGLLRSAAEHAAARPLLLRLATVPGLASLAARLTRIE